MPKKMKKEDLKKVAGGRPLGPINPSSTMTCPNCGRVFTYSGAYKNAYWDHVNSCEGNNQ